MATENTDSDLKVHALHYANELLVRVRLSFQKLLRTRLIMQKQYEKMFGKRVMTHRHALIVGKSTDHDKPHFDLFFTTISRSKKMFFFRTQADSVYY